MLNVRPLSKFGRISNCLSESINIHVASTSKLFPSTFSFLTVSKPHADEKKEDLVFKETDGNRRMISQILDATFKFQSGVEVIG